MYQSFQAMTDLESIDLSYNKITALEEGIFSKNSKLKTILLEYNPIKTLSNTIFSGLHSLKKLDLTYLRLSTLHEQTFSNLRYVLDHNSLLKKENIDTTLLSYIKYNVMITLNIILITFLKCILKNKHLTYAFL